MTVPLVIPPADAGVPATGVVPTDGDTSVPRAPSLASLSVGQAGGHVQLGFTTIEAARARAAGKPILLDLFSGAGGSARGYQRAGFYVVGVDIKAQPHYCGDEFHRADAMTYPLDGFDAIHASPPCQGYSIMRHLPWLRERVYPLLIEPMRARLIATGLPWVIENVAGARRTKVRPDGMQAGWLCGGMFGLPFYRHRYFETNWFWLQPGHPRHRFTVRNGRMLGARASDIVHNGARAAEPTSAPLPGVQQVREAMGIPWMSRDEITQAIPPAYAEYVGKALIQHLHLSPVPPGWHVKPIAGKCAACRALEPRPKRLPALETWEEP